MYEIMLNLIQKYDTIVIHRHFNPDGDAYGSQMGLKRIIELNFPDKKVYAVGDVNEFSFLGEMDSISDEVYKGALAIVVDVAVARLISDDRYQLADHVMVIDHHLNASDCADTEINDSSQIACAQLIADFAISMNLKLDTLSSTRLLAGMVTDSGRFLYPSVDAKTFRIAATLMEHGVDLQSIYDRLYTETLNFKKLKGYFINNFKTTHNNVAYMLNDTSVKDMFNVSTFTVSRAMVNQMAGIEGVEIWANFTQNEEDEILCELRSKKRSIVHIAKKYGGGGHALACGCTLPSFDHVQFVLEDLDQYLESGVVNE
jgi:phosphoesterase RecJ-like protein